MLKKYFLIAMLMLISAPSYSVCLKFYYDRQGQTHSVRCGSDHPALSCPQNNYWDGTQCRIVPIIRECLKQGGNWEQIQLRVPKPGGSNNAGGPTFFNVCACPDQKVWDGRYCRSDIPLAQQCTNIGGNGRIRVTQIFFGSDNCPKVPLK